jgi:hypothetical protein
MTMANVWKRERAFSRLVIVNCIRGAWENVHQPVVSISAPSGILTKAATQVLGDNGVARVLEFLSYPEGWDFGRGSPLSSDSIHQMERFFEQFSTFERRPSIFLTPSGNLLLGWEDATGASLELEFGPGEFVLYSGASDDERAYSTKDLPHLVRTLQSLPLESSGNGSA